MLNLGISFYFLLIIYKKHLPGVLMDTKALQG